MAAGLPRRQRAGTGRLGLTRTGAPRGTDWGMAKTVLVTGASGFVGSHLAARWSPTGTTCGR